MNQPSLHDINNFNPHLKRYNELDTILEYKLLKLISIVKKKKKKK